MGLDYDSARLDVHELLQRMKLHPLFRPVLEGGELLEWGAKTIPEGGYHALPDRLSGDGIILAGDTAGFVDVPSLKGIHYAMQTGMFAARAAFQALKGGRQLRERPVAVRQGGARELRRGRHAQDQEHAARVQGRLLPGRVQGRPHDDHRVAPSSAGGSTCRRTRRTRRSRKRGPAFVPDNVLTFSKVDAVFKSGNATRDTIPSHLIVGTDVSAEVADFYSHVCPAGVYERSADGTLVVNPPNCVDCKATDVLGPRWTPREGGSGPKYRLM